MVHGGGRRVSWVDLPAVVRAEAEQRLGGSVRVVRSMTDGSTPGMASVLEGDGGRRVFVKAISAATTPQGPAIYRREAAISGALPSMAPVPRLLWWFQLADWVALARVHRRTFPRPEPSR